MFAIMEYVWKIRGNLEKGSKNYGQILELLGDTESRMWDKINRMQLQVERCQYAKRERCEMCRLLLEGGREREVEMEIIPPCGHSHLTYSRFCEAPVRLLTLYNGIPVTIKSLNAQIAFIV